MSRVKDDSPLTKALIVIFVFPVVAGVFNWLARMAFSLVLIPFFVATKNEGTLPQFVSWLSVALPAVIGFVGGFVVCRRMWPLPQEEPRAAKDGKAPVVRSREETEPVLCPYGDVRRIVTGGEGGVANVHVVRVTQGDMHHHTGYDEVYYVLEGKGTVTLGGAPHDVAPGSVVVVPAGVHHAVASSTGKPIEFIIFGTPGMPLDDPRAKPMKPVKP